MGRVQATLSILMTLSPLTGAARASAIEMLCRHHYTHSVPSGKSHYFRFESALVCLSIPANKNIARFLGVENVWELSRLWAPNGHEHSLLTQAISHTSRAIAALEHPDCLVSYADPNASHLGGVYRAASWSYWGQCEESRAYRASDGSLLARRKFHSGKWGLTKAQIEAKGFVELRLPGKHRFIKPLTKAARQITAMP
jgi:hypothetical protein